MKKSSIIFGLALVMLAVGCSKDATNDVVIKGNKVVLGVSVDATRTSLGDKSGETYPVLWSEGDCVAVNGNVSTPIAAEFIGSSSASFEVSGVFAPYKVVYPADAVDAHGHVIVADITQDYVASSFGNQTATMVGISETEQISLKNVCGFIKLPIRKGDEKEIQKVVVRSNNLESLSGAFEVDYATGELIRPYAGCDFVEVEAEGTIPYAEDVAVVVASVAPGVYAKGFTVEVIASDGAYLTKTAYSATGCIINAGKVLVMPEIEFYPDKKKNEITNATQLQAFLDACTANDYSAWKNADGEVVLGSDIDLTGVTITPAASFDGVFDGRGCALLNWESDGSGLFTNTTASAVVKNITIDETCSMDVSNAAPGYKGFIVTNNLGTVSGCSNYADVVFAPTKDLSKQYMIGTLVGMSGSKSAALVTNCYNEGNFTITIPSMTGGSYYFGGIVADTSGVAGSPSLSNCINKGDVTIDIDGVNGWKNVYLGGVSGACSFAGIVENCINEGKVDFYLDKAYKGAYPNVGGIMGYTACNINYCKNYGDVSIRTNTYKAKDAPQITRPAIGGIGGYVNGDVTGCENHGNIGLYGTEEVRFSATTAYTSGGVGNMGHPVIGGICGCVGYPNEKSKDGKASTTKKARTIKDCHNYGTVELYAPASETWHPIGGIVGLPTGTVENCVNEKDALVTVTMGGGQTYLGGVYGCTVASSNTIKNCANYGKVWFVDSNVVALGKTTTRSYTGGISGGYQAGSGNTAIGCVNEGEVLAEAMMTMITGGLFAAHHGTITNCINRGPVTMLSATYIDNGTIYASEIGGIVGYTNCPAASTVLMDGCESYGKITNNSDANNDTGALIAAIGGAKTIQHCIVDCEIESSADTNVGLVIGSTRVAAVAVTIGAEGLPITIKNTTTINGEAVTAADIEAEGGRLVGTLRVAEASIVVSSVVLE